MGQGAVAAPLSLSSLCETLSRVSLGLCQTLSLSPARDFFFSFRRRSLLDKGLRYLTEGQAPHGGREEKIVLFLSDCEGGAP